MATRKGTHYVVAGVLFCLAAVVAFVRDPNDLGMGVVWLALGVTFFSLARAESKKPE